MLKLSLKGRRGFTLIELLAVIAILTVLAGLVAGAVTGIGASGQTAWLQGDQDTLGKAADRFFNDAFPQSYLVASCCTATDATPQDLLKAGDLGVRLVRHARRVVFQLAEVPVPRAVFQRVLERMGRLCPAPG